jgi:Domain of unknown function (DUF6458)
MRRPIYGGHLMGIGASIFLMALGAILTFATTVSLSGLNLQVVGIVLMLAGAFGLYMTMFVWGPRRRARVIATDQEIVDPVTGRTRVYRPAEEVVEEQRIYDDGRPL